MHLTVASSIAYTGVMLKRLEIESLAIIDRATVEFGPGLNVLSGETGAGKSILLDALFLLLGGRGSSEWIRQGSVHLLVSAQWEEVVCSRKIATSGKSTARVDGEVVTLKELAAHTGMHLSLYGQHAAVGLLEAETHRGLLDQCLEDKCLLERYQHAFEQYQERFQRLKALRDRSGQRERQLDLLRYQWEDIEQVRPQMGEQEHLEQELARLSHLETVLGAARQALDTLQEGEINVVSLLQTSLKALSPALRLDPRIEHIREPLQVLTQQTKAIAATLYGIAEEWIEPGLLEKLEKRLTQIQRLQAKYGPTIGDVLDYQNHIHHEWKQLETETEDLETQTTELEAEYQKVIALGQALSEGRSKAAQTLTAQLEDALKKLGMAQASLHFCESPLPKPGPNGLEDIQLLFSANAGEARRPLTAVASGGELSRLLLALSTVLGHTMPTLVFDEIDAGIGGQIALNVAQALAQLAKTHQVIVVTHLAQIAAQADHHFLVEKHTTDDGRTESSIKKLDARQRVQELARMLSGLPSEVALEHAQELVDLRP